MRGALPGKPAGCDGRLGAGPKAQRERCSGSAVGECDPGGHRSNPCSRLHERLEGRLADVRDDSATKREDHSADQQASDLGPEIALDADASPKPRNLPSNRDWRGRQNCRARDVRAAGPSTGPAGTGCAVRGGNGVIDQRHGAVASECSPAHDDAPIH